MNAVTPLERPKWQAPLVEKARRLATAATLFEMVSTRGDDAAVQAAERCYLGAHEAFAQQLERTTGLPAAEILQLLGGHAEPEAPRAPLVFTVRVRPRWLRWLELRPLLCLETRVFTITPAWILVGLALLVGVPLFGAFLIAATPQ